MIKTGAEKRAKICTMTIIVAQTSSGLKQEQGLEQQPHLLVSRVGSLPRRHLLGSQESSNPRMYRLGALSVGPTATSNDRLEGCSHQGAGKKGD